MSQHYSDPKRESDSHALPDIEVFMYRRGLVEEMSDEDGNELDDGWYWWSCFPGCLPDSEPIGPFESEAEALADARDGLDDGEEERADAGKE